MTFRIINPDALGRPSGWNHGMLTPAGGRILFVAGQTAPERAGLVEQWAGALERVLEVVRAAGGGPEQIGRLTVYVTDRQTYNASLKPLGEVHRRLMGRHFPAMGLLEFTRLTCDLILAMRQCRRPVVGALNGTVAGAGAVIAAACDVRVAAESAKIAFLFTKVGLSGADMGAAWLLPRIVGLGLAAELLMTGDFIDAQTALRIGLYNRVVAHAEVMGEARGLAERLARGPSVALGITKDALNREAHMDLVTALEAEARAQAGCMLSPNFRAAYEAFKAKHEPKFV